MTKNYEDFIAFQTEECKSWKINCMTTVIDPKEIDLVVVAQPEFIGSSGIVRGKSNPQTGQRAGFYLDAEGNILPGVLGRKGTLMCLEHVERFHEENLDDTKNCPKKVVIGFVGNGNLLMNRHFVAWINEDTDERRGLYYVAGEYESWDGKEPWSQRTYSSLVIWKDKKTPSVLDLKYEPLERDKEGCLRRVRVFEADRQPKKDIADEIKYATYGQQLIKNGKSTVRSKDDLIKMVRNGEFYDLNHLFQFPLLKIGFADDEKMASSIFLGYFEFWDKGKLNVELVEKAINGEVIVINLKEVEYDEKFYKSYDEFEESVRKALKKRGYAEVAKVPSQLGEYAINNKEIKIRYLPGIYCHNAIGITYEGKVLSFQATGPYPEGLNRPLASGRSSVTILGLAKLMEEIRIQQNDSVKDAVLLDNGGDVILNYSTKCPYRKWFNRSELKRKDIRSLILFVVDEDRVMGIIPSKPLQQKMENLLPETMYEWKDQSGGRRYIKKKHS
jgi:hypothetical protein